MLMNLKNVHDLKEYLEVEKMFMISKTAHYFKKWLQIWNIYENKLKIKVKEKYEK